ncbi:MAG: type secretion system protein VirJ [Rhizobacter sp.]|nr:type secretion system protein VirJ [Rhizobacter sp.]
MNDDTPIAAYGNRPSERVGPCLGRPGAAARMAPLWRRLVEAERLLRLKAAIALSGLLLAGMVHAQNPATEPRPVPAAVPASDAASALKVDKLSHGLFKDVLITRPHGAPQQFVILLSGAGPRDTPGELTTALASYGAMVATVDVRQFFAALGKDSGDCVSPGGPLENLSRHIQAQYQLNTYLTPLLAGRGQGASLAYAVLAQAPAGTMGGAVSMGFCPTLRLAKPMCTGGQLQQTKSAEPNAMELLPSPQLKLPWVSIQAEGDGACAASEPRAFIAKVPKADLMTVEGVGGRAASSQPPASPTPASMSAPIGTSSAATATTAATAASAATSTVPPSAYLHALRSAYFKLGRAQMPLPVPPASLADLPIIEVPSKLPGNTFAVFLSGDGGWAGIDKEVAAALNEQGVSVAGFDSLRYFWSKRTPETLAADLDRLIRYYAARWNRSEVLLIGYSQGADVLPFAIPRLPPATRALVRHTTLMGLGKMASFEFHVTNWMGPSGDMPITPEGRKLDAANTLCIYSPQEKGSLCPLLAPAHVKAVSLAGGHHFNGDYAKLATIILDDAKR